MRDVRPDRRVLPAPAGSRGREPARRSDGWPRSSRIARSSSRPTASPPPTPRSESLLRDTVDELRLVRRDGIDLRGYFHDTGIDGYDFATGFALPRGLITRQRELKDSGHWLQDLLS
jgi:hypothetical protein